MEQLQYDSFNRLFLDGDDYKVKEEIEKFQQMLHRQYTLAQKLMADGNSDLKLLNTIVGIINFTYKRLVERLEQVDENLAAFLLERAIRKKKTFDSNLKCFLLEKRWATANVTTPAQRRNSTTRPSTITVSSCSNSTIYINSTVPHQSSSRTFRRNSTTTPNTQAAFPSTASAQADGTPDRLSARRNSTTTLTAGADGAHDEQSIRRNSTTTPTTQGTSSTANAEALGTSARANRPIGTPDRPSVTRNSTITPTSQGASSSTATGQSDGICIPYRPAFSRSSTITQGTSSSTATTEADGKLDVRPIFF